MYVPNVVNQNLQYINMKNKIYLTQEGKEEIEVKIALYERLHYKSAIHTGELNTLKEILSSAIILPTEVSWEKLEENLLQGLHEHTQLQDVVHIDYPNGVIITPKQ
jgi:hypothetical protein